MRSAIDISPLGPAGRDLDISEELRRICSIAINAYIDDVRTLVSNFVTADKDRILNEEGHPGRAWLKVRLDELRHWMKEARPLGWKAGDRTTYHRLSRIVSPTRDDVIEGLPRSRTGSCSPRDFVDALYKVGMADTLQAVRPPVWSRGTAWSVLRTAIAQATLRLPANMSDEERVEEIKSALTHCVRRAGISFFPDVRQAGQRDPAPDAWTLMGLPDSVRSNLRSNNGASVDERLEIGLARASQRALANDVHAPWTTTEVDIMQYHAYVDRPTLPDDFDYDEADLENCDPFTVKCYEWANDQLRNHTGEWRCRLAIHLAFLISKLTPCVFWPAKGKVIEDTKDALQKTSNMDEATALFRLLPWVKRDNIKGLSASLLFSQAAVYFLNWIHEQSPLRKHLRMPATRPDIMGPWHHKHSTLLVSKHASFSLTQRAILIQPRKLSARSILSAWALSPALGHAFSRPFDRERTSRLCPRTTCINGISSSPPG